MHNFTFQNGTKIIFGKDTERLAGKEIRQYGEKVLFHYGGNSIKTTGLYDKVISSLSDAGLDFIELPGVVPNPRLSLIKRGIEMCRDEKVDVILAVGGGSVIDSSKAIGIGVNYDGDVWDFLSGKAQIESALPIGAIATIAAAGSETSTAMVVTNDETLETGVTGSPLVRPKLCILNPELTFTVPPYHTAAGAADMMSHIMENYFSNDVFILADRLSESVLKTVIHNLPIALQKPDDYNARAELMWAGTLAQSGIFGAGRKGDGLCHTVTGELSALYDATHGAGLALITPAWMKYVYKANISRFAQYATRVWGVEPNFHDLEETALEGIRRTEKFFAMVGMPVRLKDMDIPGDQIQEIARRCGARMPLGNIMRLDVPDVVEILKLVNG